MTGSGDTAPTDARCLTAALRDAGTLRTGSVTDVAVTDRIQTTVSNLWFLAVTYSRDSSPGLPTRVLVKWPVDESPAPNRGLEEPLFYRRLAPHLGSPPIVRCLATAPAADGHQWIILEDLRSTHTNPPWPVRPSDQGIEGAVAALATIHAQWWEAPTLGSDLGTLHSEASLRATVERIASQLPRFLDHLEGSLSDSDRAVLEEVFSSSLRPWLRLLDPRALTVTHGDAHTWNFLFPRTGYGDVYLVDWQLWHLDVGARDLAFMIALHWDRSVRQTIEMPLLRLYHQRLMIAGIMGYSFDDLWLDYRLCAVRNLTFPIILWSRGRSAEAWRHRLDCALTAYRDLASHELL